jgi:gas vesicle protein
VVDIFPFPSTHGNTPEEQIKELVNYLIQFKETLEFALDNITMDNLSPELVNKLNDLGAEIKQSSSEWENELAQVSNNSSVKNELSKLKFLINYENGHLEYTL